MISDVNDDGDLDLIVSHNGKSRGVVLRLGNGNGTFQNSPSIFSGKSAPRASSVAVGDFNRDGFVDVAVTDGFTTGGWISVDLVRHDRGCQVAFVDGHVRWMTYGEFWSVDQEGGLWYMRYASADRGGCR